MIIFNAGVPRSGTVLVNAIMRRLLDAAGRKVHQTNPHGPQLPDLIRKLAATPLPKDEAVLIHTHSWDDETAALLKGGPRVTGTINYRDPRDVCVSLMRLHDHDMNHAAAMVEHSYRIFIETVRAMNLMVIPYELLAADPRAHIFHIARRLGLWPSMALLDRIAAETSIDRHRSVMEKVQAGEVENLAIRRNTKRDLAEDRDTLINDRHIQSGVSGRWRQELDAAAQQALTERFTPLLKQFGYTP